MLRISKRPYFADVGTLFSKCERTQKMLAVTFDCLSHNQPEKESATNNWIFDLVASFFPQHTACFTYLTREFPKRVYSFNSTSIIHHVGCYGWKARGTNCRERFQTLAASGTRFDGTFDCSQ
jgi:hypothetical protein